MVGSSVARSGVVQLKNNITIYSYVGAVGIVFFFLYILKLDAY